MQNIQLKSSTETQTVLVATSSRGTIPPTKSFGEATLEDLFPDGFSFNVDPLAPFDYEGYLRREGLSC